MFFLYDWLYIALGIILIPGLIFCSIAQTKVNKAYKQYSKIFALKNITACEMSQKILEAAKINDVTVVKIKGHLTDHYNSKTKTLALSEEIYDSSSIAALGIAAHELGHVLQHKEKYSLMALRKLFGFISNLGSILLIPSIIFGLIFSALPVGQTTVGIIIIIIGLALFGTSIIFSLVTLPIEIDASKRTKQLLVETELLSEEEYVGVKKVLSAAALTYVAALVNSILNFLRILLYVLIVFGRSKSKR